MKKSLSLDTKYLSGADGSWGVKTSPTQELVSRMEAAVASVEQQITDQSLGFVQVSHHAYLEEIEAVFEKITWAKYLVVIGIGGSDLGARVVQEALTVDEAPLEVIFHGDSPDPVEIKRLLSKIDLDKTVFNIVSKSGGTVETLSQYVYFKGLVKAKTDDWAKHFVFTTDAQKGLLREEADQHQVLTLRVPDEVGGRFSVLTPVGLFPARAMGVDLNGLLAGAQEFVLDEASRHISQEIARAQYQLYEQGTKIATVMPYSVQLIEFGRWYRQLWAESLGKDQKGVLPIAARGPADQHSQIQFYNQGEDLMSIWFIQVLHREADIVLQGIDIEPAKYLEGVSLNNLINIEHDATARALAENKRPSATLVLQELTASSLGQLFMCWMLAVVYLAAMLEVNAFDQPGVELAKKYISAQLG